MTNKARHANFHITQSKRSGVWRVTLALPNGRTYRLENKYQRKAGAVNAAKSIQKHAEGTEIVIEG